MVLGFAGASAQRDAFEPLLADPKEPAFFASYLWDRSARLSSKLASVGLGQTIGLVREPGWDLAIAAGVFSQFNMQSATNDLINTDYLVGLPLTYHRGTWATRFRLYHQSSHLGDEYLLHTHAQRVDLTYEAVELLVSKAMAGWRVYGGGEYLFVRSPADLAPGVLHGGLEYHQPEALMHFGRFATGRLVAGLDGRSIEDRQWQVGWSFVTGLELADPAATPGSGWRWRVLLKAYTGPSPYGEFYRDQVSSVGLGIGFAL